MGYQQNNNFKKTYNNNRGSFKSQQNDRPKNKTLTFSMHVDGTTANGRTYDVNDALASLETLKDNGTFNMLSVPVMASRALLEGNADRRGTSSIGFIKDISISDLTADVTVFGKQAEVIESLNLVFVPRMLVKDEKVVTFLGFDLVAAE